MSYKKPLFSVLVYNFNNYEQLHEIPEGCKNPDAEYLYVTDNPDLKSDTWEIILETDLKGGNFDKTFQVRYNLFKYCHSDICVRFDGSMKLKKDITPIVGQFIKYDCEICISPHAWNCTMISEYDTWITARNFPKEEANRALDYMKKTGYDIYRYRGLYQLNFLIERNCKNVQYLDKMVYDTIKYLGDENDVHRIDQTIYSYLLNTHAEAMNIKLMSVPAQVVCTELFDIYKHGTNSKYSFDFTNSIMPYVLNQISL
jgi:hypothetical protein